VTSRRVFLLHCSLRLPDSFFVQSLLSYEIRSKAAADETISSNLIPNSRFLQNGIDYAGPST